MGDELRDVVAKENWNKSSHGHKLAKILMALLCELDSCIYSGTVIVTFPRVDSLVIHIGATQIKMALVQIFITRMSQETKTAC